MYKKLTLDNGIRVVCEKIPYVRSLSIGLWIGIGSRNESSINNGVSHFIEHMLFKGTENRSAKQIAECIDNIGGQINAFTGKECTCYYTKTLDTHMDIAISLLADMFFNSKFSEQDIEVEKRVILEEIGMYEDSPEELVHDILSETVWSKDPLGYPILGTIESLAGINKKMISDYILNNYTPNNIVISVAGSFDDDQLMELINTHFGKWSTQQKSTDFISNAQFIKDVKIREKETEQVHICLGLNGVAHGNEQLYTLLAVNNIFGGGMSSKLFQKIREEKGLAYSIYSYPSSYRDVGLFTIYAGMKPEHLPEVVGMIMKETKELLYKGITKEELEKSKEQLKGNFILGLESTSSRMNSIGKSELMLRRIYTPEEILKKIDQIQIEEAERVIKQIFDLDNISLSAVGNVDKKIDIMSLIL